MTKKISAKRLAAIQERTCARCGYGMDSHWCLNFCNGVQGSGEVLVCPTAVFTPIRQAEVKP